MIRKMLKELGRRLDEENKTLEVLENIKKIQAEMKTTDKHRPRKQIPRLRQWRIWIHVPSPPTKKFYNIILNECIERMPQCGWRIAHVRHSVLKIQTFGSSPHGAVVNKSDWEP